MTSSAFGRHDGGHETVVGGDGFEPPALSV
jgi:hypothetical protein